MIAMPQQDAIDADDELILHANEIDEVLASLQKLADKGNGNYYYLDSLEEAQRVLVEEEDKAGALFFSVYVDPVIDEKSDAELLCRLEYHGKKAFYLLTRALQ